MDREATSEDLDALREFARTRVGVEFFVEPETMVTDTTAVAVAVALLTLAGCGGPRAEYAGVSSTIGPQEPT